jgi:hypothetical protein
MCTQLLRTYKRTPCTCGVCCLVRSDYIAFQTGNVKCVANTDISLQKATVLSCWNDALRVVDNNAFRAILFPSYNKLFVTLHTECPILTKFGFSRQIFTKVLIIKFHENLSNVNRVDTCGQTDITRLISWDNMVDCIQLAQDSYSWRALVITIMNLRVLLV